MGVERDLFCQVCCDARLNLAKTLRPDNFLSPLPPFFISPINDLLDKGVFTLENLLEEDELIQEVKAKNELLIEL